MTDEERRHISVLCAFNFPRGGKEGIYQFRAVLEQGEGTMITNEGRFGKLQVDGSS